SPKGVCETLLHALKRRRGKQNKAASQPPTSCHHMQTCRSLRFLHEPGGSSRMVGKRELVRQLARKEAWFPQSPPPGRSGPVSFLQKRHQPTDKPGATMGGRCLPSLLFNVISTQST